MRRGDKATGRTPSCMTRLLPPGSWSYRLWGKTMSPAIVPFPIDYQTSSVNGDIAVVRASDHREAPILEVPRFETTAARGATIHVARSGPTLPHRRPTGALPK